MSAAWQRSPAAPPSVFHLNHYRAADMVSRNILEDIGLWPIIATQTRLTVAVFASILAAVKEVIPTNALHSITLA